MARKTKYALELQENNVSKACILTVFETV